MHFQNDTTDADYAHIISNIINVSVIFFSCVLLEN